MIGAQSVNETCENTENTLVVQGIGVFENANRVVKRLMDMSVILEHDLLPDLDDVTPQSKDRADLSIKEHYYSRGLYQNALKKQAQIDAQQRKHPHRPSVLGKDENLEYYLDNFF